MARALPAALLCAILSFPAPVSAAPRVSYATYLGGDGFGLDTAYGIGADAAGAIYVAGVTGSSGFPTTEKAFQEENPGGFSAYVAKLSPDGASLEYATYLGGSQDDIIEALAVDAAGHAYVAGYTRSEDFPATDAAVQRSFGGSADAFVAKLSPDGRALEYATYAGGSAWDRAMDIAVDPAGRAFVTGFTGSADFPTVSAFDTTKGANGDDAFVLKLAPAGDAFAYSTFLGGESIEVGEGLAIDGAGSAYVTGITASTDFPTKNAFQPILFPGAGTVPQGDAFVTKLAPDGRSLVYSSFLGGFDGENAQSIAVDAGGVAYVAGLTRSPNFPVTLTAAQKLFGGGSFDAFLSRVSADGSTLAYSTYLGGGGSDLGRGVEAGAEGVAWVTGETTSSNFPVAQPSQPYGGGTDAFLTRVETGAPLPGAALGFSTHLGGSGEDFGHDLDLAGPGLLLAGYSTSESFPLAGSSLQTQLRGRIDGIAAVLQT